MCGIGGGISLAGELFPSQERLAAFAAPLRFRGPDAAGAICERMRGVGVSLVHRRLTIIDLSDAANQPLRSESGRTWIVFNGEIYNYRSLRVELEAAGARFRTHSDTEVLLNGYELWGLERLIDRIDGMYAFGLFDVAGSILHLVRDPFGKKPCYYLYDAGRQAIAFSSDIRSFYALGVELTLDSHSAGYLFYELATPETRSIWRQIAKVPPGSVVSYSKQGLAIRRHWQLHYTGDCRLSRAEIVVRVDDLLGEAVRKRLVADVPVAALLSGGIDSSLVVAQMATASSARIATYSVGFDEAHFSELRFARDVAERYGTDHHEIHVRPQDLVDTIRGLVEEFGEPFADSSMVPMFLIAKAISPEAKVVLGGDGGDELFAGYYPFYFARKLDQLRRYRLLAPAARVLHALWPSARTSYLLRILESARVSPSRLLDREMGFARAEVAQLFPTQDAIRDSLDGEHARVWGEFCSGPDDRLLQVMAGSMHTRLSSDYLVKVDRASMYASVEVRSPFLDKDLARFAATLPSRQLLENGVLKSLLREVARSYIPAHLVDRPKAGFSAPIGKWLREALRAHFAEVVLGGRQTLLPMDYSVVERLLARHLRGEDLSHRLWTLFVFHLWAQRLEAAPDRGTALFQDREGASAASPGSRNTPAC